MNTIVNDTTGIERTAADRETWPPTMSAAQERAFTDRVTGASDRAPHAAPQHPAPADGRPLPSLASVHNLATWAIVLGVTSIFVNPLGGVAIAAIVCGALSLSRRSRLETAGYTVPSPTLATVGLVLGAVALVNTGLFKAFLL